MSSKIDIISSGYAFMLENGSIRSTSKLMKATGSCCLVRTGHIKILFDTMGPWEKNLLRDKLAALKVHPEDVDLLVCSHSHPDHIGNINLFTKAKKHFVGTSVYSSDVYELGLFEPIGSYIYTTKRDTEVEVIKHQQYRVDNNVYIEPTPGHTMECISVVVRNCDLLGTVGLVGDLFERQEDINDESVWLSAGSQNADLQRANRSRIYNEVDFILPGHGSIFETSHSKPIRF